MSLALFFFRLRRGGGGKHGGVHADETVGTGCVRQSVSHVPPALLSAGDHRGVL